MSQLSIGLDDSFAGRAQSAERSEKVLSGEGVSGTEQPGMRLTYETTLICTYTCPQRGLT